MTVDEALALVKQVFGAVPRPEVFVRDPKHCCECAEHEGVLAAHTPDSISLKELGNPGWDPICFAGEQTFAYFMPAMVRLVFEDKHYLDQFLFHLITPRRVELLTTEQAKALREALWAMAPLLDEPALKNLVHTMEEALQRVEVRIGERAESELSTTEG